MRIVSVHILALFLAIGLALPWSAAPPIVSGAQDPTPTVTATMTPTTTTTPATATNTPVSPVATETVTTTPTVTVTPGGVPRVTSVSVSPTDPNVIVISGESFTSGATVSIEGQQVQTTFTSPNTLSAVLPPGLPPGVYNILVANPGFPPGPPLLAPLNQGGETRLHVPVIIKRPPIDSTALFVQNISQSLTNVNVTYYDLNGFSAPQWNRSQPVPPGESAIFDVATNPAIPPGFDGSAIIEAQHPITAVVNRLITLDLDTQPASPQAAPPPGDPAFFSGRSSGGSFTITGGVPATTSSVPVAFGGYNGYFTTISIQNTGNAPGNYSIAFSRTGLPVPISTIQRTIAPHASTRIRIGPEAQVPPDFVGSVVITGAGSTLAVAVETIHVETGVNLTYSGFPAGTTTVNTPLLFKNYNGWISGAQVVNLSAQPVFVNATIIQRDVPIPLPLPGRPLAPNESVTYYLPAINELPDDFVGSAVFQANGPIAVVVQQINAEREAAMAYTGFGAGTPRVSVPVIFKDSAGWDTGIQVQNLGQQDAFVTATYHLPGGLSFSDSGLIAVRGSTTFYQGEHPGLPPNAIGAVTISSGGGQPIVAIVNEVNYARSGDSSMAYEGINY